MIILDNVSLRIKKVQILEGISLELEDGQIHGLVGRNGCGKIIGPEEIRDAMKQVELDPDSRLHVKKYSMGMRQRLGIAQAIMEHPRLLVLDEPFNGLDEDAVRMVRNLLDEKREQGVTIVLSSHNAEDIRLLCDFVYRLFEGRLCTSGTPG